MRLIRGISADAPTGAKTRRLGSTPQASKADASQKRMPRYQTPQGGCPRKQAERFSREFKVASARFSEKQSEPFQ
jgi:hypothetical protein